MSPPYRSGVCGIMVVGLVRVVFFFTHSYLIFVGSKKLKSAPKASYP